jgi:hypothetical protein
VARGLAGKVYRNFLQHHDLRAGATME